MIQYDFHIHTSFSSDSKTPPEAQIERAIELGMKGICITDHMDYEFPDAERSGMDFEFDPEEYLKKMDELRNAYADRIELNMGVEIGLRNEEECRASVKEKYDKLLAGYPFDFVIGSTHCLEFTDPYYESPYWDDKDMNTGIRTYFEAVRDNILYFPDFDSLGHLDYLIRYVPESRDPSRAGKHDQNSTYRNVTVSDYDERDFMDIIDEILKSLIESGKALEVNSAGLKYGLGYPHPKAGVLKRYRELGGELITIGSDGHRPEHICYDFRKVYEILKELDFRYYAVYRERKAHMIKL